MQSWAQPPCFHDTWNHVCHSPWNESTHQTTLISRSSTSHIRSATGSRKERSKQSPFVVVIWFFVKTLHPAFSSCILNLTDPHARCHDKERERDRTHASFKEGHCAVVTAIAWKMHNSKSGLQKKKKQPPLTTLQVQREDGSDSERQGIRRNNTVYFIFPVRADVSQLL